MDYFLILIITAFSMLFMVEAFVPLKFDKKFQEEKFLRGTKNVEKIEEKDEGSAEVTENVPISENSTMTSSTSTSSTSAPTFSTSEGVFVFENATMTSSTSTSSTSVPTSSTSEGVFVSENATMTSSTSTSSTPDPTTSTSVPTSSTSEGVFVSENATMTSSTSTSSTPIPTTSTSVPTSSTSEGVFVFENATMSSSTSTSSTSIPTSSTSIPTTTTTHLTTTTHKKPIHCYDVSKRCARVKALCTRDVYKNIMMRQCARTCNFCPQFARLPHAVRCRDSFHSCPIWAQNGFCHSSYYTLDERNDFCRKSCEGC